MQSETFTGIACPRWPNEREILEQLLHLKNQNTTVCEFYSMETKKVNNEDKTNITLKFTNSAGHLWNNKWASYYLVCYNTLQPDFYFKSDPIKVDANFANTISPYPVSGTMCGHRIAWQEETLVPSFGQERMVTFCELSHQTTEPIHPLFTKKESWTCRFGDEQLEVFSVVEKDAKLLLHVHVPKKKGFGTVPVTFICAPDIGSVATNNLTFTYVDYEISPEDKRISQNADCHESNESENIQNESQGNMLEFPDDTEHSDWYIPSKVVDIDGRYHKKRRLDIEDAAEEIPIYY